MTIGGKKKGNLKTFKIIFMVKIKMLKTINSNSIDSLQFVCY